MAGISQWESTYNNQSGYPIYPNGASGVFKAKFNGYCADCRCVIREGENAQYLYSQFGHPCGVLIGERAVRICQMKLQEVSLNDYCGECVTYTGGSVTDISARIRATETALSELYARQELLKKFGTDAEYPDGAVILSRPSGSYWRTAVKVSGNCWHYSGTSSSGYRPSLTFDRLVEEFLVSAREVWFATEFTDLL